MTGIPVSKHSSLYLTDGNICLAAVETGENKKEWIMFRVHQSILSIHSPIFRDMLALPSGDNIEQFEGVPLVRLPDNASDIEAVLEALYFGYKLPYPRLHPDTPIAVQPILSIANKYQISYIRDIIVDRLESDWPQSLMAWDTLEAEIKRIEDSLHFSAYPKEYIDDHFPEPASAIRLALDCNIPTILPAAFYQLARTDVENDRTRRNESTTTYGRDEHKRRSARWELLYAEDLMRLMKGQKAMRSILKDFITKYKARHSPQNLDSGCDVYQGLDAIHRTSDGWSHKTDPSIVVDPLHWYWIVYEHLEATLETGEVCNDCLSLYDISHDLSLFDARTSVWNGLSGYFDLVKA